MGEQNRNFRSVHGVTPILLPGTGKGQRKRLGISCPAEWVSHTPSHITMELLLQRLVLEKTRNGITEGEILNSKCRDWAQPGATRSLPSEFNRHRSVLDPFLSPQLQSKIPLHLPGGGAKLTLSICLILCFLLRRLCLRMRRDEVLCSVELLNLGARTPNVTCKAQPPAVPAPLQQQDRGNHTHTAQEEIPAGIRSII